MTNGIFTKGETVEAYDQNSNLVAIFRIAQPDHKLGDINSPDETFNANPYDTSLSLGSAYSASTTVLTLMYCQWQMKRREDFMDIFLQVM